MHRALIVTMMSMAIGCGASPGPAEPVPPAHDHGQAVAGKPGAHDHHHHSGPMVHRFDGAENWAKRFDSPERDAWQRPAHVIALMDIAPGSTVADLGAGTGYFEGHLSAAVGPSGKVLALDVEPDMVRYLRERAVRDGWANVEARLVPADDPQLTSASVDRILTVDTWHHLGNRSAYAAKLAAALRPGGALIVVDFTLETTRGPPVSHRLAPDIVLAELRSAGLEAELIGEELPDQYVVVGRKPRR